MKSRLKSLFGGLKDALKEFSTCLEAFYTVLDKLEDRLLPEIFSNNKVSKDFEVSKYLYRTYDGEVIILKYKGSIESIPHPVKVMRPEIIGFSFRKRDNSFYLMCELSRERLFYRAVIRYDMYARDVWYLDPFFVLNPNFVRVLINAIIQEVQEKELDEKEEIIKILQRFMQVICEHSKRG